MKASILISTLNRHSTLTESLPRVLDQDFPVDEFEVVVVSDGCTDGTVPWLRSLRPRTTLRIVERPHRGIAAARNASIVEAMGDILLFLDDDIICPPSLLSTHVASHAGGSPLLVFGPLEVHPGSPRNLAVEWTRQNAGAYIARLSSTGSPRWPDDALLDANSSIRREWLLRCGLFDERFILHRETADLGLRLWKMGVRFTYEPRAAARHLFVKRTAQLAGKDALAFGRGEVLLSRKHPDYRPHSFPSRMSRGKFPRRLARSLLIRYPNSPRLVLSPILNLLDHLYSLPGLRSPALRLLQVLQAISMYRAAADVAGSWDALNREFGCRLPVLLYHNVGPLRAGSFPELTVAPEVFKAQMAWLSRNGFVGIHASDWVAWRSGSTPLPRRPVMITFDDGYADIGRYALPVLRRHGLKSMVFIVTGLMGSTNEWDREAGASPKALMTEGEIRAWARDGVEFGAHGRLHKALPGLPPDELDNEVRGSAEDLSRLLAGKPQAFAYPFGEHDAPARRSVASHFDLSFATTEGMNDLSSDPLTLRRSMVQPGDTMGEFILRVTTGTNPLHAARRILGRLRGTVLGRRDAK